MIRGYQAGRVDGGHYITALSPPCTAMGAIAHRRLMRGQIRHAGGIGPTGQRIILHTSEGGTREYVTRDLGTRRAPFLRL